MKNSTTQNSSVSKLINRFDMELKTLLMNDLKAIKAVKAQLLNINAANLSAA